VKDDRVLRLWLNPYDYADLRKFGSSLIDPATTREELKQGIQGVIWNAQIRLKRKAIPQGFAVLISDNEATTVENADLAPDWKPTEAQLVRI
jgi:hypothetical protein